MAFGHGPKGGEDFGLDTKGGKALQHGILRAVGFGCYGYAKGLGYGPKAW